MLFVRFLSPLLMIVLGLGVGVVFAGRRVDAWRLYFVGVLAFVFSQLLHVPFNAWVLSPWLGSFADVGGNLFAVSVFLGLSAGVFEEVARYVAYRFVAASGRDWRGALMLGAGHGGVEAVLVGLFVLYTVMQLTVLRGQDVSLVMRSAPVEELERVQAQINAFWSLPWYGVLLGALERLVAICFHLSASVLVLQVFRRKNFSWLLVAILWHALLDALAVFVSARWSVYWAEGVLFVVALFSVWIVWSLRDPGPENRGPDAAEVPLLELERRDVSPGDVEGSKYAD